jgi:SAM-dependent methyltransferase
VVERDYARRTEVTVKDLVRPIPGVRTLTLLRQRLEFSGSASFWERKYSRGETSGPGSYGRLGEAKAEFLNSFVRERSVGSIIEFGCGDGHQLSLAAYPQYVGLDVSRTAIELCRQRFAADLEKSFFLYDGQCFIDKAGIFKADLALSLDVLYHLIEDSVFETYMVHLFAAGCRYVVVYATDSALRDDAPHVRHRHFTPWVEKNCRDWRLAEIVAGPNTGPQRADFFIYEQFTGDSH